MAKDFITLPHVSLNQPLALDNSLSTTQIIHKLIKNMNEVIDNVNDYVDVAEAYTDEKIGELLDTTKKWLEQTYQIVTDDREESEKAIYTYIDDCYNHLKDIVSALKTYTDSLVEKTADGLRLEFNLLFDNLQAQIDDLQDQINKLLKNNAVYSPVTGTLKPLYGALYDVVDKLQQIHGLYWNGIIYQCLDCNQTYYSMIQSNAGAIVDNDNNNSVVTWDSLINQCNDEGYYIEYGEVEGAGLYIDTDALTDFITCVEIVDVDDIERQIIYIKNENISGTDTTGYDWTHIGANGSIIDTLYFYIPQTGSNKIKAQNTLVSNLHMSSGYSVYVYCQSAIKAVYFNNIEVYPENTKITNDYMFNNWDSLTYYTTQFLINNGYNSENTAIFKNTINEQNAIIANSNTYFYRTDPNDTENSAEPF